MALNSQSDSDVRQITSAVDTLNINATESQTSQYLIGDDFDRNWSCENLTLPNIAPPILMAEVTEQAEVTPTDYVNHLHQNVPFAMTKVLSAKMVSLNRITSGNSKVVYEACLHLPHNESISYEPGDSIAILCQNHDQDVDWILKHTDMGHLVDPDTKFLIKPASDKTKNLPNWFVPHVPVTARILLGQCCELHIPVTRRMTRLCADFSTSKNERIRLLELSSRQGHQMFEKLIRETSMTLPDLFASFPSIRLPLIRLVELLPRLQPRPYSLTNLATNSSSDSIQQLRFIFTRVDFTQSPNPDCPVGLRRYTGRIHGTCTGWLERLWDSKSVPEIPIYLRTNVSNFRMPSDVGRPVVMIGAGTGVAPFISFIKARESQIKSNNCTTYGPLWLIFGCRSFKTNFPYKQYILKALQNKILDHLCLCFSREPIDQGDTESLPCHACLPPNARHVQDCLTFGLETPNSDHAQQLSNLIVEQNAQIMVCGELRNFAPSVQEALVRLMAWAMHVPHNAQFSSNANLDVGRNMVKQMQVDKRYLVDVWL